jgi:hypothetical protein
MIAGGMLTRFGMVGQRVTDVSRRRREEGYTYRDGKWDFRPAETKPALVEHGEAQVMTMPSIVQQMQGHYWGAGQGFLQCRVGWECLAEGAGLRTVYRRILRGDGTYCLPALEASHTYTHIPSHPAVVDMDPVEVAVRWIFHSGFCEAERPEEHPC